jgi:hypothetical protein
MYSSPCCHFLYRIVVVLYYSESRTPPVNDTRSVLLKSAMCDPQKLSSVEVDPNLTRMAGDAEIDKESACKMTQLTCFTQCTHRIDLFRRHHAYRVPLPTYRSNDLGADDQTLHFDVTNNIRRANATSLRTQDKDKQKHKT